MTRLALALLLLQRLGGPVDMEWHMSWQQTVSEPGESRQVVLGPTGELAVSIMLVNELEAQVEVPEIQNAVQLVARQGNLAANLELDCRDQRVRHSGVTEAITGAVILRLHDSASFVCRARLAEGHFPEGDWDISGRLTWSGGERSGSWPLRIRSPKDARELATYHLQLGDRASHPGWDDFQLPIRHYELAARAAPGASQPLLSLGWALERVGRNAEALRAWESAFTKPDVTWVSDSRMPEVIAGRFLRAGDRAGAVRVLQRVGRSQAAIEATLGRPDGR